MALSLAALAASLATIELDASACIDPTEAPYGAVAGDGLDDRAAIQAAIDNASALPVGQREVCVPFGRFHATRKPLVGAGNIPSLKITANDVDFHGEGMFGTTIAMLGTGIFPGQSSPGDWRLFDVREGAKRVVVHDIHFDGSEREHTNEQTHLTQVTGPTGDKNDPNAGVVIERVRMTHPPLVPPVETVPCIAAPAGTTCANPFGVGLACGGPTSPPQIKGAWCDVTPEGQWTIRGWYHGGDCWRIFGEWEEGQPGQPGYIPDQVARNTIFRNNLAPVCDRAWVSLQRGHDGTQVIGGDGCSRDDAMFDSEPTGARGYRNLLVDGPHLSRCGGTGGGVTFSIGGSGATGLSDAVIDCRGKTIPGGGTRVMDASRVTFRNCIFHTGTVSAEAPLAVVKRAQELIVEDSVLIHPAGAPFQPSFVVRAQNGARAEVIKFRNVRVEQHVPGPVIDLSSVRTFEWSGGELVYTAAAWTGAETTAIIADSIIARTDTVSISGVKVTAPAGSFEGLVRMGRTSSSTVPLGGIILTDIDIAPGALRSYVAKFNHGIGAALHIANVTGAPNGILCGGGCP